MEEAHYNNEFYHDEVNRRSVQRSASRLGRQCDHRTLRINGHTASGKVRRKCVLCGSSFTDDGRPGRLDILRKLGPLYRQGLTAVAAARETGHDPKTVRKYFRVLQEFELRRLPEQLLLGQEEVRMEAA